MAEDFYLIFPDRLSLLPPTHFNSFTFLVCCLHYSYIFSYPHLFLTNYYYDRMDLYNILTNYIYITIHIREKKDKCEIKYVTGLNDKKEEEMLYILLYSFAIYFTRGLTKFKRSWTSIHLRYTGQHPPNHQTVVIYSCIVITKTKN